MSLQRQAQPGPPAPVARRTQASTTPVADNALPEQPKVELTGSRQFTSWLQEQKASLAFTTYQSGKLWLLDSGNGNFGYVDLERGRFEPVAFCPGYARGLAFIGDFAVVGLSKPRENKTFSGLALDDRLREKNIEARCQLQVIDLKRGDVVHSLRIEGVVSELYDVVVLPGVRRPTALGFKSDEIRRVISVGATPQASRSDSHD